MAGLANFVIYIVRTWITGAGNIESQATSWWKFQLLVRRRYYDKQINDAHELCCLFPDNAVAVQIDGDNPTVVDFHFDITNGLKRIRFSLSVFQDGYHYLTIFLVLAQRVLKHARLQHLGLEHRVIHQTCTTHADSRQHNRLFVSNLLFTVIALILVLIALLTVAYMYIDLSLHIFVSLFVHYQALVSLVYQHRESSTDVNLFTTTCTERTEPTQRVFNFLSNFAITLIAICKTDMTK